MIPTASSSSRPIGGVPLVAGARLPLAFIGFGLVCLGGAAAWLAFAPELLALPFMHPAVAALAHFWLPGFLLSVCLGAVYQLMPVVLGAPLQVSLRATWIHFGLHAAGVAAIVGAFVLGRYEGVAAGGVAVALGALVLLAAAWKAFRASARRDAIGWCFPLAATWLALAVWFGVLLGLNRRLGFLPLGVVDLLQAHAHVGLAGFFLTLLQGATFQLVPMFTMAEVRRPRWVAAGLWLAQLGLLGLTPALAAGHFAGTVLAGVLLAAGIGATVVALASTFRSRRRRVLEPGLKAFALGAALLAVAAAGGVALAVAPEGAAEGGVAAYAAVVIPGALSLTVLGMLCKIVPFLVWMRVYGPRAGRQQVPLATMLGSKRLEHAWLAMHGAALLLLIAGLLAGRAVLTAGGCAALLVAVGLFLGNMLRVLAHLVRPLAPVPVEPRAAMTSS